MPEKHWKTFLLLTGAEPEDKHDGKAAIRVFKLHDSDRYSIEFGYSHRPKGFMGIRFLPYNRSEEFADLLERAIDAIEADRKKGE